MNIDLLFSNFDLLNTSEKIQKLKQAILQLAVQGKLVPQEPNDEPASELLKRIKVEKEKLIKEGKLKKEKPLPPIPEAEMPYEIPNGWEWVRLGELTNFGITYKVDKKLLNDKTWILYLEDIEKISSKLLRKARHSERKFKSSSNQFQAGDVLYGKLRPYLDKVIVADEPGICSGEILPIRSHVGIDSSYLRLTLKRPDYIDYVNDKIYGTKMPRLGTNDGRMALIPLAPTNEQKRIVEQVDELFSRADEIESSLKKADEEIVHLNKSALNQLLESKAEEEFKKNFEFIVEQFDLLYSDERNVKELRQAILQLAVQGKLVPQNPNDEPSSELIKRTNAEKEKLIKEGKLKKQKPLPPISKDEIPYELPAGWRWIRMGDIKIDAFTGLERARNEQSNNLTYAYFKMNNIRITGECDFLDISRVNASSEEVKRYQLLDNDFLFNTRNSYELVGKTCVFKNQINEITLFNNNILKIVLPSEIDTAYINFWFISPNGRQLLNKLKSFTTNVAAIYQNKLMSFIVPLAPKEEQLHIVMKVQELTKLCDELESKIIKSKEESERLTDAILQASF